MTPSFRFALVLCLAALSPAADAFALRPPPAAAPRGAAAAQRTAPLSMAALSPGDKVLVLGSGPVMAIAAKHCAAAGYETTIIGGADSAKYREMVRTPRRSIDRSGFESLFSSRPPRSVVRFVVVAILQHPSRATGARARTVKLSFGWRRRRSGLSRGPPSSRTRRARPNTPPARLGVSREKGLARNRNQPRARPRCPPLRAPVVVAPPKTKRARRARSSGPPRGPCSLLRDINIK